MLRRSMLVSLLVLSAAVPARAQRAHDVRAVMQSAAQGVRRCVEESLRRGEDPRGPLITEIHIARSGRVEHVHLEAQGAPRFERCASRVLKRLRFPPMSSAIRIRYPMNVDAVQ